MITVGLFGIVAAEYHFNEILVKIGYAIACLLAIAIAARGIDYRFVRRGTQSRSVRDLDFLQVGLLLSAVLFGVNLTMLIPAESFPPSVLLYIAAVLPLGGLAMHASFGFDPLRVA